MKQVDAYADAYNREITDKSVAGLKASSSKLMKREDIKRRIAELQKETSDAHGITVDSIIEDLKEAQKLAKEEGQVAAMVNAIKEKARMAGVQPAEKHDININGGLAFTINPVTNKK
ncbi:MAG: hypothetical protein SVC26_09365 [Pseudomonadota bacterium]|nr:hypothetical protein [Pseudomonadota bacterium]